MLTGLTDSDLEFCYHQANALVYPSFVEGFGLPLIESLDRKLPVLASDIPVFREIVGDFATYFDLSDPDSLCDAIKSLDSTSKEKSLAALASWSWPSWLDSATQLMNRVKRNIAQHTPERQPHLK
jgi:alpha-1,2-rhamnosyltransferase